MRPGFPRSMRPSKIPEDRARGVGARRTHDAAPGVRARTAHVYAADRRAVLSEARHRPVEQQLIHGQFTLEYIAFRQSDFVLDVPRRAYLGMQNELLEVRAVPGDGIDDRIAEALSPGGGPLALRERVGAVLHEHRHVVLAVRNHGRIDLR